MPNSALLMHQGQTFIFVVDGDRLKLLPVTVERIFLDRAWIAGNLSAKQLVVSMGVHMLTEGQKVRVRTDG